MGRVHAWLVLLVALISLLAGGPAAADGSAARPVLRLAVEADTVIADPALRVWVDRDGRATPVEVAALPDEAFAALPRRAQAPRGRGQALWIRLTLQAPADAVGPWFLNARQVSIDELTLYRPLPGGGWLAERAGTAVPVAQWPIIDIRPTWVLPLTPGETQTLLLRVHDPRGSWSSLQVMTARGYIDWRARERLLMGLYAGVTLVVVCLGLANWVAWRERLWLSYAGYHALMTLGQMSIIGLAGTLLLGHWPRLNEFAIWALISLGTVASLAFVVHASRALRFSPLLARLAFGWGALILTGVVLFWFFPLGLGDRPHAATGDGWATGPNALADLLVIGNALVGPLVLALALHTWRRGHAFSLRLMAAFSPVVVGSLPQVAYSLNLIPRSFWTEYAFVFGLIVEAVAMLYVLQQQGRAQALNAQRLREFDRFDALTGLVPRPAALEPMDAALARARRDGRPCNLMYVRLLNHDALTREHGPAVADPALLLAAQTVARQAQAGDLVARTGPESFLLVFGESRASEGELRALGASVVATGLRQSSLLPAHAKLDYGVWIARLDGRAATAAQALQALERVADQPCPPGARRIRMLDATLPGGDRATDSAADDGLPGEPMDGKGW